MPQDNLRSPIRWEDVVSVREDTSLERELSNRWGRAGGEKAVGVTDLLALRKAFYRAIGPAVPIPPERQARLDEGRTVHRDVGTRLSQEGILEARVRRDGLVGRIDILAELPVEVKTSSAAMDLPDLVAHRPDHVEQLGMYCGLVGRPDGRLLTLVTNPQGISDVQVADISFRSPNRILAEMRRRADLLRSAWTLGRVDALPRCPWYGRGCEYEEASVCSCTGEEEPAAHPLVDEVDAIVARDAVRERVRAALSAPLASEDNVPVARFREVLYPRRAYFDRIAPRDFPPSLEGLPPAPETPPRPSKPDLYARLTESMESGPPGEVARLPPRSVEPEDEVVGFRGRPVLVRTSRAWARFRSDELITRSPQYVLELGLRCATVGADSGLVIVGFERAEHDRDRIQVLELRFASLTPFSRIYRERSQDLTDALRERSPEILPGCPEWMVVDCPYRSECGCAGAVERAMR